MRTSSAVFAFGSPMYDGPSRSTLALTNLDFEYELLAKQPYRGNSPIEAKAEIWRDILRLLPQAREAETVDQRTFRRTVPSWERVETLICWGVTPSTVELASKIGLRHTLPDPEVVRLANSKLFSHALEKKLGLSLPYSSPFDSSRQLEQILADCPYDWVIKHPFGVSGRERMVGRSGIMSDSARGWARTRLEQGWTLLFEPWVRRSTESSVHFQIAPNGGTVLVGHCQLVTDAGGVYRGNRIVPPATINPAILAGARAAAEEVAALGYWGPVGIDTFEGHLGDSPVIRPLVEINARYTFGRLALSLGHWIPAGWSYLWWHPRQADLPLLPDDLVPLSASYGEGVFALPAEADPRNASRTAVLIAETPERLDRIEESLLRSPLAPKVR